MKRLLLAVLVLIATAAACDGGSGDDVPDIDAAPSDGVPPIDAAACFLPSTTISCTIGDNTPCTAMCASAYCYNFSQVGTVCTQSCTPGSSGECPTGWTCNNMGRCRPPG
jgi:hypothetical protein